MPTPSPDPGSRWTRAGEVHTVSAVTRQRVILVGDEGGYAEVSLYEWPAGFELVPDPEADASHRIEAMLVGGASGDHFVRIKDLAAELGVDVVMHVPMTVSRAPATIPRDVELVIFLVSHMSHKVFNSMKDTAQAMGIPVVLVPSGGFKPALQLELERKGIRVGGSVYGGVGGDQHWEWTGEAWSLVEEGRVLPVPVPSGNAPVEGESGAGDNVLAGLLSLLPFLLLL
jgi:hypothetical protein